MKTRELSREYLVSMGSTHLLMETPEGQITSRTLGPYSTTLRFDGIRQIGPVTDDGLVRYEISACLTIFNLKP